MDYYDYIEKINEQRKAKNLTLRKMGKKMYICDSPLADWFNKRQIMRGGYFIELLIYSGYKILINDVPVERYGDIIEEIKRKMAAEHIPQYQIGYEMDVCGHTVGYWLTGKSEMRSDKMLQLLEILGYEFKLEVNNERYS